MAKTFKPLLGCAHDSGHGLFTSRAGGFQGPVDYVNPMTAERIARAAVATKVTHLNGTKVYATTFDIYPLDDPGAPIDGYWSLEVDVGAYMSTVGQVHDVFASGYDDSLGVEPFPFRRPLQVHHSQWDAPRIITIERLVPNVTGYPRRLHLHFKVTDVKETP